MAKRESFKVVLAPHVVCYPKLLKAESFKDNPKKEFQIEYLIPEDHKDVDAIFDALDAVYDSEKNGDFRGVNRDSRKYTEPFRHWEEVLKDSPDREEVRGHYVLKAKTTKKPVVYNEDREPMEDYEVEDLIAGGAVCRGVVAFTAFNWEDTTYGALCFLNSVQYWDEGTERFGSGGKASPDDYDDEYKAPKRSSKSRDDDDAPRGRGRGRSRASEDDEEAPRSRRGRSRASEDDEDEAPRGRTRSRSRASEEDEEDEAPRGRSRGRSRASEDDEEEEAPRSRRRR